MCRKKKIWKSFDKEELEVKNECCKFYDHLHWINQINVSTYILLPRIHEEAKILSFLIAFGFDCFICVKIP